MTPIPKTIRPLVQRAKKDDRNARIATKSAEHQIAGNHTFSRSGDMRSDIIGLWRRSIAHHRRSWTGGHPRPKMKGKAGTRLAPDCCEIVRSRRLPSASRAERPGEPRARKARPPPIRKDRIGGKFTKPSVLQSASRATANAVARLSHFRRVPAIASLSLQAPDARPDAPCRAPVR